MTARAASSRKQGAASVNRNWPFGIAALIIGFTGSAPALAQVAGSVGLDSDYQLRGYSLTDDHPALSAQISYDHPSGAYVSLLGLTELGGDNRFLGVIGDVGYAKRLNEKVTLDVGVLRSQIRAASPETPSFKYLEVYAGGFVGPVSGRVYFSPAYRSEHQPTLYGELEAGFEPVRNWRLSGHIGLLTYLGSSARSGAGSTHLDGRISIARKLGQFEVHAILSTRTTEQYEAYQAHAKPSVTFGGSMAF